LSRIANAPVYLSESILDQHSLESPVYCTEEGCKALEGYIAEQQHMAATMDIAEDTAEAAAAVDTAAEDTAEGTAEDTAVQRRRLHSHTVAAETTGRAYMLEEERLRLEAQEAETPVVAGKLVRSGSNSSLRPLKTAPEEDT